MYHTYIYKQTANVFTAPCGAHSGLPQSDNYFISLPTTFQI